MDIDEQLISIKDVAAALRCSPMHVYRLVEAGELEAIDIATPGSSTSRLRVRPTILKAYLERATLRL